MRRVLIADDEPHVVRLLTRALEQSGYSVVTASNGKRAIAMIRKSQPDVLITDIEMPHMNGRELCLQVEKELPDRQFLTLVISSSASIDHREWATNLPNTIFIEKPISTRKLLAVLGSYFESFFEDNNQPGAQSP